MKRYDCLHGFLRTSYLTHSFRFGPAIGLMANTCLEKLNGMKRQILVGGKKQDFLKSRDDLIDIRQFTPIAVIGRTNFAVFKGMFYTLVYHMIVQDGINVQDGKISKIDKCAGWNKDVQAGFFQNDNKLSSTFIR